MEEFVQEFRAEATSIIQQLQENLLMLEQDVNNKELVEEIFRGIHTLKGSSRMFGFEKIEQITHELENTFDQIREGEVKVSGAVISLSLSVVDMASAILIDNYDQAAFDDILAQLGATDTLLTTKETDSSAGVFQVLYHPHENIYERGINPMTALDDLYELGEYKTFTLKQPKSLKEQEKSKKFESVFEVLLDLKGSKEDLEDVFLFMNEEEFSIHQLEADQDTWQEAMERAQNLASKRR